MNEKEIIEIINSGETTKVQFKEKFSNESSISAEMIAMSNSKGGIIVFGVKDKTGEFIGLNYEELQFLNNIF